MPQLRLETIFGRPQFIRFQSGYRLAALTKLTFLYNTEADDQGWLCLPRAAFKKWLGPNWQKRLEESAADGFANAEIGEEQTRWQPKARFLTGERETVAVDYTPRPRYPSDDPQNRRQRQSVDSARTPQSTPQATPPSDNGNGTVNGDGSVSLETNGYGTVPLDSTDSALPPRPLRMEAPLSLREELIAVGFSESDAEMRVKKHPAQRIRDALDEMTWRKAKSGIKKTPDAFIAAFLDGSWDISPGLAKQREAAPQQRMALVSAVVGGSTYPPAVQKLEPVRCPPPTGFKDMLKPKTGTD